MRRMARKARKLEVVPRDNVRTLRIGETAYELEASLGTSIVYRNEFLGRLDAPYTGILDDDVLTIWRRAQRTIAGDGGEDVENPDYAGLDVLATLRVAWAMARAAGSTGQTFDQFMEDLVHQPAGVFEEASLYGTVVLELGGGIIFRRPEGRGGDGEADEAQEAERAE